MLLRPVSMQLCSRSCSAAWAEVPWQRQLQVPSKPVALGFFRAVIAKIVEACLADRDALWASAERRDLLSYGLPGLADVVRMHTRRREEASVVFGELKGAL